MRRRAAVSLFVFVAAAAIAQETPLSSALRQLQQSRRVDAFWSERAAARSAPMIERIEADPAHVLATFLWRGDAATKNVYVITFDQGQFHSAAYLHRARMALLPGTDVWYRTYRMPCDLVFSYRFSINDPGTVTRETSPADIERRNDGLRSDPLNEVHYASRSGDSSVAQLPCAAPQPDMDRREGVAHGEVKEETFTGPSGESHPLQIYLPPRPAGDARPLPLVITIGGQFAENYPIPLIVDNLITANKIPPVMIVTIGFSGMGEYVSASRSNERFARYVAKELLPHLRSRYSIDPDAKRIVVSGSSAPGAASLFIGMRYPESFGNVIAMSGGYAYPQQPQSDELIPAGTPEAEPIARELAKRPALPQRIFLAVGTLDDMWYDGEVPGYGMATVLVATRHLRDVLEARGYRFDYREFGGGHEALIWRRTFAEALVTLLGRSTVTARGAQLSRPQAQ